ncbi:hypothetical protein KFJ24_08175 [Marinobacter sediminum]|uniref:F0F1 ATP synthase subunit B family protein n=1 Tax=Marinobacter sediminum TaxID=256323 RepID=UPI0020301F96|nr:hypothetical protein [Marinobacter sediminum]MCM0612450.1 hypothetical protein [Marinobacter sediminum]
MDIDWITVSAQAINFLILVWLLKRFLYQPVIKAMDKREHKIRSRMEDADAREEVAREEAQKYKAQADALKQQQDDILEKTREEARQERSHMLDVAREETARVRASWMREVNEEKAEFIGSLRRQTLEAIESIAGKALQDLADSDLEARMVHTFIQKLPTLDQEARESLRSASEPACISSHSELDPALQKQLTGAVHDQIGGEIAVTYTTNPELGCGIELMCNGERVSWNLSDYLEELTTRMEKAFKPVITEQQEA